MSAMGAELSKSRDEHVWDLGGRAVTMLILDRSGFRFHCWTLDGDLEVRLETPFEFHSPDKSQVSIDPEQPQTVAPLLNLVQAAVQQLRVKRSGELTVIFTDGTSLRAWPHPIFEAWEINGVGELGRIGYLCSPGDGSPWG